MPVSPGPPFAGVTLPAINQKARRRSVSSVSLRAVPAVSPPSPRALAPPFTKATRRISPSNFHPALLQILYRSGRVFYVHTVLFLPACPFTPPALLTNHQRSYVSDCAIAGQDRVDYSPHALRAQLCRRSEFQPLSVLCFLRQHLHTHPRAYADSYYDLGAKDCRAGKRDDVTGI